jgi:diguanylate cyclase (GGDEF)-like protein
LYKDIKNFYAVIKNVPDIIIRFSKKGNYLGMITDLKEGFFLPVEDLLGKNIKEIFPDDIAETLIKSIDNVLKSKSAQILEHELVVPSGKLWFEARVLPLKKDEVVILIRDITDYRVVKQKLDEAYSFMNDVVKFLPDATFVINNGGQVCTWNKAMEKMSGIPEEGILGKGDYEYAIPFYGKRRPMLADIALVPDILSKWVDKYDMISWNGETLLGEVYVPNAYGGKGAYLWGSVSRLLDNSGNVIGAIECLRDVTDYKLALEKISYISLHDGLTGLYNRRFLEEEMRRLDTKRQLPIGFIVADLNILKLVNDIYGHSTGDAMLRKTAEILKRSCRHEDIIARWGGDEFIILLPQTNTKGTIAICKRIKENCKEIYIQDLPLSIALGTAVKKDDSKSLEAILKEAEDDMYKQKVAEGRKIGYVMLKSLLESLGAKDFRTKMHIQNVKRIALKIGKEIKLPDSELNRLNLVTTLYDIGKVNISKEILAKKGLLTGQEWEEIKKHPEVGYRIVNAIEGYAHVAEDILAHHECWDGTGYPRGLKGEKIPLLARITAIASAYAMLQNGFFNKNNLSRDEIKKKFQEYAGNKFDPKLVKTLFLLLDAGKL